MASNYFEVFSRIWESVSSQWEDRGPTPTFLQDFIDDLYKHSVIRIEDVILVVVLGVAFTIARYATTTFIFKPLSVYFQFITKDRQKFPESAWKLLYYICSYLYCCYILFSGKYPFMENPESVWIGWNIGIEVPYDIYVLYAIQVGFYFHSIYGTVFMDIWRRDSVVMILHHVLTLCLLVFSISIRYHNIGVIVLFLHDIADIFLEFTKICVCFKSRPGAEHRVANALVNVGFLSFAFVWWKCRLYEYPYRVLYVCAVPSVKIIPHGAFYMFFNGMLWMLFVLNIWWFHFVLWLIWRVMKGQSRELEDVRELSHEETKKESLSNGDIVKNGKNKDNTPLKKPQGFSSEQQTEKEEKNGSIENSKRFPHQRRKKNLQGN